MMPWNRRDAQLWGLLQQILDNQQCMRTVLLEIKKMATAAVTQQQFTTDLGKLQGDVTTMVVTLNALDVNVKQLKADVAALKAANPTVDFSALDATANQMDNTIVTANANVQAEVPNPDAPPVTTAPPTTEPPTDPGTGATEPPVGS
jgi:hypothetical protein